MAEILKGKPVAEAIVNRTMVLSEKLKDHGITPLLAILRVGEDAADISYEKGAVKRCEQAGISVRKIVLEADVSSEDFYSVLDELNNDPSVHGILMFRPLPKHLDSNKARQSIAVEKDIDGCTDGSLTGVFTNSGQGFAPCTAQAVIEIFDYYGIDLKGKNTAVIGRSLVVGKPLAMMLVSRHATVTICHTRTVDVPSITSKADIVVAAAGQPEAFGSEYFSEGQIVADVGISWSEEKGKLCGDAVFDEVEPVVAALTPVPGGVGAVTTSVLVSHVAEAAARQHHIS